MASAAVSASSLPERRDQGRPSHPEESTKSHAAQNAPRPVTPKSPERVAWTLATWTRLQIGSRDESAKRK